MDYLNGGKQMVISWKEMEENPKAPTKKANPKPVSRKKGKEPDPPQSKQRNYLDLYEDIEDADDPDGSDMPKDVIDKADVSEPTASRIPQVGTSRSAVSTDHAPVVQSAPAAVPEDDPAARLERLREARRMVRD